MKTFLIVLGIIVLLLLALAAISFGAFYWVFLRPDPDEEWESDEEEIKRWQKEVS